jgi:hypothetical protein
MDAGEGVVDIHPGVLGKREGHLAAAAQNLVADSGSQL